MTAGASQMHYLYAYIAFTNIDHFVSGKVYPRESRRMVAYYPDRVKMQSQRTVLATISRYSLRTMLHR
jgi:hypothetical protein